MLTCNVMIFKARVNLSYKMVLPLIQLWIFHFFSISTDMKLVNTYHIGKITKATLNRKQSNTALCSIVFYQNTTRQSQWFEKWNIKFFNYNKKKRKKWFI